MLTSKQRHDSHDIDPRELKLIRVGHALWAIYKKERGKSETVDEQTAVYEALETVWSLKRQLRAQLAAERAKKTEATRQYFKDRQAA